MARKPLKLSTENPTMAPLGLILAVTPSDASNLQIDGKDAIARSIQIGAVGTLRITDGSGTVVNFASGELAVGYVYPFIVIKVWSTGTTATSIKAGY